MSCSEAIFAVNFVNFLVVPVICLPLPNRSPSRGVSLLATLEDQLQVAQFLDLAVPSYLWPNP